MKTIKHIFLTLVFATVIFGCEKIENPSAINNIDETKTATIKGLVLANMNTTNDTTELGVPQTTYEAVPAGTKIFIEIDSKQYATKTTTGEYQLLVFEALVNENGEFEVSVPALPKSIEVTILPEEFVTDQTVWDVLNPGSTTTKTKLYSADMVETSVIEGQTTYVKATYDYESYE